MGERMKFTSIALLAVNALTVFADMEDSTGGLRALAQNGKYVAGKSNPYEMETHERHHHHGKHAAHERSYELEGRTIECFTYYGYYGYDTYGFGGGNYRTKEQCKSALKVDGTTVVNAYLECL